MANRYDIGAAEFTEGRDALLGAARRNLRRRPGFCQFCASRCLTFGERATVTESAATKALLWYGKSVCSVRRFSEQAAAATYLNKPAIDVESSRIGMFGYLARGQPLFPTGLPPSTSARGPLLISAAMPTIATLIELGAHDPTWHLPDRSRSPQLKPPPARSPASSRRGRSLSVSARPTCSRHRCRSIVPLVTTRAMYGDGTLEVLRQPGIGHEETPEMRAAVLDFFARTLRS